MTPFKKVLHLLADGEFHSGAELGKILGLTRSAIWKLTQQFKTFDIELESIIGKGYRIPNGLSLLDKEKIQQAISTLHPQPDIEIWDSLASTNDFLLEKPPRALTDPPLLCLAERQTQGKGRRGRSWISPFARNLYFSLLWSFQRDLSELCGLSLVTALTILKALNTLGIKEEIGIKWPNDIVWKSYFKLGGVLIEVKGETHHLSQAVIGIGLNVHLPNVAAEKITQPWTDIVQITGKQCDRNDLTALLVEELISALTVFQTQGLTPFIPDWQHYDLTFGKEISISSANGSLMGIGRGINPQGLFLLELPSGEIHAFASGEVSLRILTPSPLVNS